MPVKNILLICSLLLNFYLAAVTKEKNLPIYLPSFQLTPTPLVVNKTDSTNEKLVQRVIDGDTFILESGETVRFIGIDAPETTGVDECFAAESKDFAKNLLEGKIIRIEKDVSEKDRYGRLLSYVYLEEIFVNEYLVQEGYAVSASYPPDIKYQERLKTAQREAFMNKKGLWEKCQS